MVEIIRFFIVYYDFFFFLQCLFSPFAIVQEARFFHDHGNKLNHALFFVCLFTINLFFSPLIAKSLSFMSWQVALWGHLRTSPLRWVARRFPHLCATSPVTLLPVASPRCARMLCLLSPLPSHLSHLSPRLLSLLINPDPSFLAFWFHIFS